MRRKIGLSLIVSVVVGFLGVAFGDNIYTLDPNHTFVKFIVRHLVISKVEGKFRQFSGTITYDEKDITKSSMTGRIQAASIDTGNTKRDKHLRSVDFLSAEGYPEILFVTTRIEKQADVNVLMGKLTIRGVTKDIAIPFTVTGKIVDPLGQPRIGFEASLHLNRQDYGVSYSRAMDKGGLVVGNQVTISLVGEACQPSVAPKPSHQRSPFFCKK